MPVSRDDPTVKNLRSGLGKQVKSEAVTMPAWGFGTSAREAQAKLYTSPEQEKATQGNESQGAIYKIYDSIGKQIESVHESSLAAGFGTSARSIKHANKVPGPGAYNSPDGGIGKMIESRRPTSPRATFGTSNREDWSKVHIDEELMKTYYGRGTPGPAVYSIQGAGGIGKQLLSTKANAQQAKIGTSGRPTDDNVKVPGPGAYRATSAIGKQTVSLYKTLPTAKIGTSTRDQCYKVFLSKEHEKGNYGIGTPGPVTANQSMNSALGRQTVSRRPTSPGWGFGTAKRYSSGMSDSPGPGAYWA